MKNLPKIKRYFIETYGCQMNKYDSELVAHLLEQQGYQAAKKPADADIILVNTCSVREHAEIRALGRLTALNEFKLKRPGVVLGVLGCMAQRIGKQILAEKPFVNLALGPDSYRHLPELIHQLEVNPAGQQPDETDVSDYEDYSNLYPSRVQGVSAWVAIMRGCNNFCAYCIVPYLRGRERSRRLENILTEVAQLATDGFKEVTLLGQNVNSYHDGEFDFPDLLGKVSEMPGIERVRFASSHPKDLSPKLIDTIAARTNICQHIHLAVQSGSSHVLKLMNRNYTREHYLGLIASSREKIPDISFTTDIIVGFPGETEADFADTLDLVQQAQFDNAFTFKYCPRAGTKAAQMAETVSDAEKQQRLEALIRLQNEITLQRNRLEVGKRLSVLVEGPSKKSANQYKGRTETNKVVIFEKKSAQPGEIVAIKITAAEGHTLFGEISAA
jgi:tRNA-2-methylthio-N6-dimethylallyladenosine synthase